MGCIVDQEKTGEIYDDCVLDSQDAIEDCSEADGVKGKSKYNCKYWIDDDEQSPCLACHEIMTPQPIETAPRDKNILLYWEDLNHYEDGVLYDNSGEMCHQLHDGSFDIQPTHWLPRPVLKREEKG